MADTVKANKAIAATMNVDTVDSLMEQMQEQKDNQTEMDQLFAMNNELANADMGDLDEELSKLEEMALEEQLAQSAKAPTAALPATQQKTSTQSPVVSTAAPSEDTTQLGTQEAAQLAELKAMFA